MSTVIKDQLFTFIVSDNTLEYVVSNGTSPFCSNPNIPKNINVIGKNAFQHCTYIGRVQLPESVEIIEDGAFRNCYVLTEIVIPNNVREIGNECFSGCRLLYKITFGQNIEKIGARAFKECEKLEKIVLPPKVIAIEDETFIYCKDLKILEINENIQKIGKSAFYKCSNLEYLYFKDKHFPTFQDLKNKYPKGAVILPDSLNVIDDSAFSRCGIFEDLILPKNINFIGKETFFDTGDLKYIKINKSNISFTKDNFNTPLYFLTPKNISSYNKKKYLLKVINLIKSNKYPNLEYKKEWKNYISKNISNNIELLSNPKYVDFILKEKLIECKDIPMVLEKIGNNVELAAKILDYQNNNFTQEKIIKSGEVNIQINLTIESTALSKKWNYESIDEKNIIITGYKGKETEVTIPSKIGNKKVVALSRGVFSPTEMRLSKSRLRRNNIVKIIISEGIEKIGVKIDPKFSTGTFEECKILTDIVFPKSLKSIEGKAFINCYGLKNLTFLGSLEKLTSDSLNKDLNIEKIEFETQISKSAAKAFCILNSVREIVLGEGVSVLYAGMFGKCSELQSVEYKNPNIKFEENSLPKIFFISNFTPDFIEGKFSLLSDNNFPIKWINNLDLDKKNIWCDYMQQELYNAIVSTSESSKLILSQLIAEQLLTIDDATKLIELLNNTNSDEAIQAEKINMLKTASLVPENGKDFFQYHLKAIRRIMINY